MVDLQTIVDTLSSLDEDSLVQVISSVLMARPELAPPIVNFSIPDLTYPPSRALTERRGRGIIKSFNQQTGFGFIQCDELHAVFGHDVFLHNKQLGPYGPGDLVSFAVCLSKDNKPQAYDLMPAGGKGGKGCGGWGCGHLHQGGGGPHVALSPAQVHEFAHQMKGKGWSFKGNSKGKGDEGSMTIAMAMGMGAGFGMGAGMQQRKRPFVSGSGKPDEQLEMGQHRGVIKSFNADNGYGFIACPDLQEMGFTNDVFLHHQQLGLGRVGDEVFFTVYLNSKGQPQAKDLLPATAEGMQMHSRGDLVASQAALLRGEFGANAAAMLRGELPGPAPKRSRQGE